MLVDELLLRAVGEELRDRLEGARVEKVYQPRADLVFISLHPAPNGKALVLSTHRHYGIVCLTVRNIPNPPEPPTFCRLLRKHLIGCRLYDMQGWVGDRIISLSFRRLHDGREANYRLELHLSSNRPNLILRNDDGQGLGKLHDYSHHRGDLQHDPDLLPPAPPSNLLDDAEDYVQALRHAPTSRELANSIPGLPPFLAEALFSPTHAEEPARRKAAWLQATLSGRVRTKAGELLHPMRGTSRLLPDVPPDIPEGTTFRPTDNLLDAIEQAFFVRGQEAHRDELRRTVGRTILATRRRLTRLRCNLMDGLQATNRANALAHRGELLKTVLTAIPPRAQAVDVDDWATGRKVTINLDPALSPQGNLEKIFDKAKKARRSLPALQARREAVDEELRILSGLSSALENAKTCDEVKEIADSLRRAGLEGKTGRKKSSRRSASKARIRRGLRTYHSSDGYTMYVGRNAHENDYLSRRMITSTDMWFHVREAPGAHVVVKAAGSASIPRTTLDEAAQLAVHFSGRRFETRVSIHRCRGADIRRPSGAPPGTILVHRGETVSVRPDPAIIRRLLANESLTANLGKADGHGENE